MKRVGILMLLLWIIYALPFIHIIPYLFFNFKHESPSLLWGLAVNPYMLDEKVIQLTAMIGAIGGIGFALGILFDSKLIIVQSNFLKSKAAIKGRYTQSLSIFSGWVIIGIVLSWLTAPEVSLFSAAYTYSKSALENANFSSAWMISYILLAFSFCDAILDKNKPRSLLKKKIVISAIAFVVIFLQLLRGNRESIPFIFGILLVYFYWASAATNSNKIVVPWKKIIIAAFLLAFISMILDATRSSLTTVHSLNEFFSLLSDLYKSDRIGLSNILHGTWSAVLLTPLSIAGDYTYNLLPLKLGKDYIDLILSIPPGFIADLFGYVRPIDGSSGPAWEMRYGIGGTHASVLPFMNFRMLGVFIIPIMWTYFFTRFEKKALKKISVLNLALLCTIVLAAPHWLWYGEKNILNAIFIWAILSFCYRVSITRL